jgi:hypothetical protein
MTDECLAPFAERRLAYIEPFAVLTLGPDNDVHVRMGFIGVKGQGISMLGCILFFCEVAHSR